jgi:hypothetical protein
MPYVAARSRGSASIDINFDFDLFKDRPRRDFRVDADVLDFVGDQGNGQSVSAKQLKVEATASGYRITGPAMVGGVSTLLDVRGKLPQPERRPSGR